MNESNESSHHFPRGGIFQILTYMYLIGVLLEFEQYVSNKYTMSAVIRSNGSFKLESIDIITFPCSSPNVLP